MDLSNKDSSDEHPGATPWAVGGKQRVAPAVLEKYSLIWSASLQTSGCISHICSTGYCAAPSFRLPNVESGNNNADFLNNKILLTRQYCDNFNRIRTTECPHGLESQSHDSEPMRIVTRPRPYRSLGCTFTRPFPPQVAFTRLISNFCSGDLTPCESFLQVARCTSSYTKTVHWRPLYKD